MQKPRRTCTVCEKCSDLLSSFLATLEQIFLYCYGLVSSEMVFEMGTTSINFNANRKE